MKTIKMKKVMYLSEEDAKEDIVISISGMEMELIPQLKMQYPKAKILADLKLDNEDYLDIKKAYNKGVDIVSVLALSKEQTILDCLLVAKESRKEVLIDFEGIRDIKTVIETMDIYGVDYMLMHDLLDEFDIYDNEIDSYITLAIMSDNPYTFMKEYSEKMESTI